MIHSIPGTIFGAFLTLGALICVISVLFSAKGDPLSPDGREE